ncbi:hypothetical protein TIFTF001_032909 [Ficus carica]|uniref:Uncharacterized protein n=1 Tax=Ficus carica TaxID=3494 RepID=A0AA88J6G5_FICCA|nr:hypothetical protein TIFTF001_032909 [Ficus carica]
MLENLLKPPMSKPKKLVGKNITPEKRSLRVMTSAKKRPPVEKIPKKPTPEKKRRVPKEGLKRKQGEIEVKESKKAKRAVEEKKILDAEKAGQVLHNIVMSLTNHSGMGDALWFENIWSCSRRMQNLTTTMTLSKLGLLYMIFCIPLANANSVKIDPKNFALADNLEEFNAFPWVVLSWEATQVVICNTVENRLSLKRKSLKKVDKVHYSIAGFPHVLLVWAYENFPTIVGKFMTKYVEAISRMLSWTFADNVKFDAVMSALTAVGEKQLKCFVMMPTDEELKEPCVA